VRRRLVVSTIAIVLVVLGAIAAPIGLVVYQAGVDQIEARLDQQVAAVVTAYNQDLARGFDPAPPDLADMLGPGDGLQVTRSGDVVFSNVPFRSESTWSSSRATLDGSVVSVLTDADPLDADFRAKLRTLLILALGAVAAAAGLAAVQAHQLARPLERLAGRAARLGDGDFSSQPFELTEIPEIDHIGVALDNSAEKVATMLANERHFTADATHQLRTGIAGIAMRLEILTMSSDPTVVDDARAGLAQTDQLNSTIDDLLAATRSRSTDERVVFDLAALVASHVREWQPRYATVKRHVSMITSRAAPPVFGTKGLVGQVIDILIDNALKHGAGSVTLMIDGPSVIVIDQGVGVPDEQLAKMFDGPVDPAARHGRGLSLARRLAQVDGASLDVVGNQPLRFRLRLQLGDHQPVG
jgi:signal transduction histidine kinase